MSFEITLEECEIKNSNLTSEMYKLTHISFVLFVERKQIVQPRSDGTEAIEKSIHEF